MGIFYYLRSRQGWRLGGRDVFYGTFVSNMSKRADINREVELVEKVFHPH